MNDQSHTLHLSSKKSPPPLLLRLAVCPAQPMPRLHGWTPPSPPPRTRKRWAEPSIQIAHPHPPPQSLAPHHPIAFSPLFPLDVDGGPRLCYCASPCARLNPCLACMAGRRRLHRHVQENGGQNHPFKSHTPTLLRNP